MTDDDKNIAKIIEVAVEVIDRRCQIILNLSLADADLQDLPAAASTRAREEVRPAIRAYWRYPQQLRESRTPRREPSRQNVASVLQLVYRRRLRGAVTRHRPGTIYP